MLRRTPFKRPERARLAPSRLAPVTRGVRVMCSDVAAPAPKENALTSHAYQAAVRKLPCIRCGIVGFTQFCHSDEGKGLGIKTDDRRGWPGCGPHGDLPGCHWIVGTSGQLSREERRATEARYAEATRARVMADGNWPKRLPPYEQKQELAYVVRADSATNLGAA